MLYVQVKKDQLTARKEKDKAKASLLTTLIGELDSDVTGKSTTKVEVTDAMVVAKIKKFVKSLDALVLLLGSNGPKQTEALMEISILAVYLPKYLTEGELTEIIKSFDTTNMGTVMKLLKEQYAGLYDGKLASKIAKQLV
jgi:uncharacterized protein YqeY